MTAPETPRIEELGPTPPRRSWSGWQAFLAAAAVVLIVVGGAGAFALFRLMDPGPRLASAEAIAPDTDIYIDIDFRSLGELDRLLSAFDGASAVADMEPGLDPLIDRLDKELRAELGVGVDDVTPWVGRDVGIGISGLAFGSGQLPEAEVIVAVSVRDGAGADAFVDRMVDILGTRDMLGFREATHAGVRLLISEGDLGGERIVVARSDDLLLLANDEDAVRRAIDTQSGSSLADDDAMNRALDALPGDRAITMYMRGDALAGAFDEAIIGAAPMPLPPQQLESLALGIALVPEGLRLDVVEVAAPVAGEESSDPPSPVGSEDLPGSIPASAFAYLGFAGPTPLLGEDVDLEDRLGEAGLSDRDLEQLGMGLQEVEAWLGFDIEDDLLRHLGGDLGIALGEAAGPLFGEPDAPQVALLSIVGLADPSAVADTAARFAARAADEGVVVSEEVVPGGTRYGLGDGGTEFVWFGVENDHLVMTTDIGMLDEGDAMLGDDPLFQSATAALPQDGPPFLFVDLHRALAAFAAPPEVVWALEPIAGVVANVAATGEIGHSTVLVLIEY